MHAMGEGQRHGQVQQAGDAHHREQRLIQRRQHQQHGQEVRQQEAVEDRQIDAVRIDGARAHGQQRDDQEHLVRQRHVLQPVRRRQAPGQAAGQHPDQRDAAPAPHPGVVVDAGLALDRPEAAHGMPAQGGQRQVAERPPGQLRMRHHVLQCRDHQGHGQQHARQRERQVAAQDHHAGGENGVADGVGTGGGHRVRGGWGMRTLSSGSPRPARGVVQPRASSLARSRYTRSIRPHSMASSAVR